MIVFLIQSQMILGLSFVFIQSKLSIDIFVSICIIYFTHFCYFYFFYPPMIYILFPQLLMLYIGDGRFVANDFRRRGPEI